MSYPFLPVNPCCETVIINDVCGCNSTVNNVCNDPCFTTSTASSTIVYNGPILPCIIAEPCDTLNVVLQKIDEVVCNLLSQINTLTTQVNNINTQIITINNEIVGINNTLTTCCTECFHPNLITNGTFNSGLSGWSQTITGSWVWSTEHGGSANFTDSDTFTNLLYQNILTPGVTYDITFNLWMLDFICSDISLFSIEVYAGNTVYGPFKVATNQTVNLILECTNNSIFGFKAFDNCGFVSNSIFVDDVVVKEHCPNFTTTTTTLNPLTLIYTNNTFIHCGTVNNCPGPMCAEGTPFYPVWMIENCKKHWPQIGCEIWLDEQKTEPFPNGIYNNGNGGCITVENGIITNVP